MGLYDRDYTQADFKSQYRFSPQLNLPRVTPVVKWLLIINIVLFISAYSSKTIDAFLIQWFSIWPESAGKALQLWRVITYQFLHSTGRLDHILFNMLGVYFFGTMLEGTWGSRKFLLFYLICGAAGGVIYPVLSLAKILGAAPLIGASGAILGMLAAGAILYPNATVYLYIFPMRFWVLVVIYGIISILNLFGGINSGGEVAHLSGMAAGAIYVLSDSWREKFKFRYSAGRWEKKISMQRNLQVELDRILEKVHKSGIHSLTFKEKRTLKQATKAEQMKNKL